MNYYAQGGQAHGLKAIAQELQDMGRGGDTMLAHINPQEAALLKRMGGSGTINPATGLPEFWGIKLGPVRVGSDYGGVSIGRTSVSDVLDKSGVADLIGKLGPVATTAAALYSPWAAGIVGSIGKEGKINFQKGLLTGALAYGAQNLAEGLSEAGTFGTEAGASGVPAIGVDDAGVALLPADAAATSSIGASSVPSIAFDDAGQALLQADQAAMSEGLGSLGDKASYYASRAGQGITEGVSDLASKASNIGKGAYKLATGDPTALQGFNASGATLLNTAGPIYAGSTGLMALAEQEKQLEESLRAGAIAQEEYNQQMERIQASKQRGVEAMQRNPYMFAEGGEVPRFGFGGNVNVFSNLLSKFKSVLNPDVASAEVSLPQQAEAVGIASSTAEKINPEQLKTYLSQMKSMNKEDQDALRGMLSAHYGFAYGGSVDDESGMDDLSPVAMAEGGLGNLRNGLQFAKGGQPRFLSGGGDGMSDDIPATINGRQPARLADGEFVIPADVVSHLGNGSSKAGAKQLYSMMDKVRTARTGTKKQGKQINPTKYMPA